MRWGIGPSLGLLTAVGYALFLAGAARLWRNRSDLNLWVQDEVGFLRRGVARYATPGEMGGLREEGRFKLLPSTFLPALGRMQRARLAYAAALLILGPILFLLDFLI